ncbi:hypothetical protein SFRURICE_011236, partial [Spodoptera frugiperda]
GDLLILPGAWATGCRATYSGFDCRKETHCVIHKLLFQDCVYCACEIVCDNLPMLSFFTMPKQEQNETPLMPKL